MKNKRRGILSSILFGLASGFSEASQSTNKEDKNKEDFIYEELKNGNPEPYEMEHNELDDDMFQDYDEFDNKN